MESSKKLGLTAAVAAGYVLGRTKKGKLALGLAPLVAGAQLPMNPRELIILAMRRLAENPTVGPLVEQARGEVLGAGRSALSASTNRRLEAFADTLQRRTEALLDVPGEGEEDEEEEAGEEEFEDEDEPAEESEEDEEAERPRRAAKRPPAKKAPAKKTAAKKAPAKRAPAKKKAAAKKPAAEKSPRRDSRRR